MAKFYLTTPLYYVNSKPHIGHSYTNIAADALARFHRLGGKEVLFLTGTDEHGQKIDKAAQAVGMTPQDFTDKMSLTFRDLWKTLDISQDDFIRTTEPRHRKAVQAVWNELMERGRLYKAAYSGWYCTPDENFWADAHVLKAEGKVLCPDCKRPVERIEEENYFLKMSDKRDWLIRTVREAKELVILPQTRRNEVLGFLESEELKDLCISRPKSRLSWGIPCPLSEAHVTYVWFDALINYITASGYPDREKMKKWWPADVHLIGKDILRHHAVYWPIILEALGLKPPKMVFAHGWWVQSGEKMSKSRGNVIDPVEMARKYGVDAYRYFLLSETPFGSDGTFSEEALIDRYNRDLANDLGNLLHRTLTMCEKYFGGEIPKSTLSPELQTQAAALPEKLEHFMQTLDFSNALAEIWLLINQANKFIEESAPWKLAKEKKEKELKLVMTSLLEILKVVAKAISPFMPATGEAIEKQLGAQSGRVAKGAPLFPRIEVEK